MIQDCFPTWILLSLTVPSMISVLLFGYIFISGSKPGTNKLQDDFIKQVCNPNDSLLNSVLTIGYAKASWRRFYTDVISLNEPKAKIGLSAPDACLVNLAGKKLSLVNDYINKLPSNVPLVLNFGSFT